MTLPINTPTHSPLRSALHSPLVWKWGGGPEVQLSSTTIAEDAADNTVVGALSVANLGVLTVSSYAITADPSNKFAIVGTDLTIDELLDYETATSHTVTIQATLSDASTTSRTFSISVTDVDEGGGDAILDTLQVETDGLVIDGLLNRTLVRTSSVDSASTPAALLTYTAPSAKFVMNSSATLVSGSTIRTEYDASANPLGILIEEARTNLMLYSEELNQGGAGQWAEFGVQSVVAGTTVAPDGTSTAETLSPSAGTSAAVNYTVKTIVSGSDYALSFYVKKGTHRYVLVNLQGTTVNHYVTAVFDLDGVGSTATQTGVGATSGTLASTLMTSAGNGWYRLVVVGRISLTGVYAQVGFAPAATGNTFNTDGQISSTWAGTETIYAWGAQLELGAFATSYIKTTTATVTRAIDNISLATSSFPYSATLGNITTSFNVKAVGATIVVASLSDGTANERISSFAHTGSHLMIVDGGVTQDDIDAGTVSAATNTKLSTAWQLNSTGASINGAAAVAGDGAATIPTMTTLRLFNRYDGTVAATGHLKYLKYLPRRITNANLATEST
jgi:hypothetical protein